MTTSSRRSNTDDDGGSSSRSNHVGILSRIWDFLTTSTLSTSILSSYTVRRYYQVILLSVITIGWFQVLYRSCLEAYMIRGYAIREFGYIIHEFDPYFNYRATEYLYENGWYEFKTWFDYKVWYPLGRPVGTTIYPGMQVTAVLIKKYIQYGTHGMSINDICCMMPAWFGVCATLATTWLTYEVTSHNVRRKNKNQHPTTTITTKRRSSTSTSTSQHSYSSTTITCPSFDSAFNDIPIVSTIYQYIIIPLVTFLLKVLYYLTGSTWGIQTPRPFDHYEAQKYKQEQQEQQQQQGTTRSSTLLLLLLQQMMINNKSKSTTAGKTGSSRKNGNKKSSSSSSSGKGKKKGKLSLNSTTSTSSTDSNSFVESSSTSSWYNNTTTSSSSSWYHFRYSSSYDSTYLTPLSCAVCSGMIMSIVPAHLLRSIAGGYDNESIAMTAMVTTFACWTCSLRDWTYDHNGSNSSHMTTTNEDNNNSDHSEGGGRDDDQDDDDDDDDDNNNNATTMSSSSQKTGFNNDGSIKDIQVRKLPSILIQLLLSYKPSYDEICTILLGICTGLCYFYMVAAWGGYVFVLNMIGIHCTFLVCIGRYSTKLHRAYTCFYIIGTCLAIQVPVVGYTPIKSLEQLGPLLAFCGIQLIELCQIMKRYYRLNTIDTWKVRIIVFGCSAIIGIMIIVALVPTGYFGPISSRVRGLFVKHTKTGNPLVDSVAEHQAASPQAYYQYLNKVCFIAPIGCIMTVLFFWNDSSSFILIYSISAYFFSLKMVRLVLLTAPIASICGGICLGRIATWMCNSLLLTKDELYYDNCSNHQNEKNNKNTTTNKKKTTTAGSSSSRSSANAADHDDINMNSIFGILSLFYPTSSKLSSPSGRKDDDDDDDDDDDATPLRANGKVRSSSPAKNGAAASSSKATSATNGSTNGGSKKKYGSSSNKQAEEEQEEEEVDDVVAAINAANAAAAGSSLSTTIGKKTNPSEWFQRNKQIIGDPIWVRFVRLSVSIMAIYKVIPYFTDFHTMSHQVAKQISHPTIINKAQTRKGDIVIVDDYREAYFWLRDNTPQDARIMAWWDYGYQITGIGNRTTIADGNTWNHEHIALLGRILTSPEKDAHRIARHLADYVLVWAGGGGDDVAKSPHLRRIANSVYRGLCREPTCSDFGFRPERGPTKSMRESLLYKLHSNGLVPNVIADKNRFKEVFSSKYGKVRIYKIMSVSKESKNWVLKNRICDAPGSWFCPGQYPPALTKILDEKQDFMQLEDFNVQKKDGQDDSEYQREYFENLMGTDKNKKNNNRARSTSSGSSSAAKKKATEQKELKKPVEMDPDDDEISEVDDDDDDDDHEDISKGRKMKLKLLPPDEVEYINSKWENNEYTTVMYEVINKNAIQQFGYLLSEKPEIAHMRSEDGRGPMFWAYEMNRKEMISILEKVGVRNDRKDIHGKTPIDLAK